MGGKSGGQKYRVTDYFMGIHFGICHGPVDALLGVWIKERDAWPGTTKYDDNDEKVEDSDGILEKFSDFITRVAGAWNGSEFVGNGIALTEPGEIGISKGDLFGGEKKEGGVIGRMTWLPGKPDQVLPDKLADMLAPGKTGLEVPGFRGYASAFFHSGKGRKGFMWCQNNPYLPTVWLTLFRKPRTGLDQQYAVIQVGDNPPDVNPAHIVYECLTNRDWGMGAPSTIIDETSFEAASALFFGEKFGLSMAWIEQAKVEDFVSEVIDHVQMTLYVNPRTGLIEIKPIRDDYVIDENTPHFTPDNCDTSSRQRAAWSETINEINVTWTNPKTEKEETVTFHDNANLAMQGALVSDTRPYYGIRRADLARDVGARDIRSAALPLYGASIEADRKGWDLLPGQVCLFSWPEDGVENMVMRVGKVDYGAPGSPKVKAELLEDVFSLGTAVWTNPPGTVWEGEDPEPDPFDHVSFLTMPYPALVREGLAPTDDQYPVAAVGILASHNSAGVNSFDLSTTTVLPNGDEVWADAGTYHPVARSTLAGALAAEAESVTSQYGVFRGGEAPAPGDFGLLGAGDDDTVREIVMFDSYDAEEDEWTLARGVMDTVPRAWPVGTPLWVLRGDSNVVEARERVAGEEAEFKLQPRTSAGLLPEDQAEIETYTVNDRPYLPFRPANVTVAGSAFEKVVYEEDEIPTDIPVTWANRNRLGEDQVIKRWTDGTVTPEDGQTTKIVVVDGETDTVITTYDELTGTTFDIPVADLSGYWWAKVRVYASRDGLDSLQAHEVEVEFHLSGYGYGYGLYYGEGT